jgi:type IV secretion system protein VirB11
MKATRALLHLMAPFAHHLEDTEVTDVTINEPYEYWVERAGQWRRYEHAALSLAHLDALGLAAAAETSKDFSRANPLCGSTLPGGERIQINRPPATIGDRITVAIRRPFHRRMLLDDPDFDEMVEEVNTGGSRKEQASGELMRLFRERDWRRFLGLAVEQGMSIGICGAQGSGKSELAKRLLRHVPDWRRAITIEDDSPEFGDAGPPNRAGFLYGTVGLRKVMPAALRMRADEVIFQEARGEEVYFLAQAALRGARIMTTWHAEFGREFEALASMYRQSEFGRVIGDDDLHALLRRLIDIVVWQYRDARAQKFRIARIWFRGEEKEA